MNGYDKNIFICENTTQYFVNLTGTKIYLKSKQFGFLTLMILFAPALIVEHIPEATAIHA